jgi:hypothetical protein
MVFVTEVESVYSAELRTVYTELRVYALSPYIEQIRFVFKRLIIERKCTLRINIETTEASVIIIKCIPYSDVTDLWLTKN